MTALKPMGIQAGIEIHRPGYVPSGQGCLECSIQPLQESPSPLNLLEFGRLEMMGGIALSSHLKHRKVSERMRRACQKRLRSQGLSAEIQESYDTPQEPAYRETAKQAGACLAVWAATDTGCILGSDMAGAPGRPAEEIGRKVADHLLEDLSSGAPVDRFLADQLIPFAALAKGDSLYRIPFLTDHVQTRLWLARELLGAKTAICGQEVRITGIG